MSRMLELVVGFLVVAMGLFLFGCATPSAEDTAIEELPTEPLSSGDAAPDFTLPDGDGNLVSLADHLLNNQLVVLVFYEEFTWGLCIDQLVGLVEDQSKFEEKGVQIIALAVQPESEAASTVEKTNAQFPILADSEHAVADAFGVYSLFSNSEAGASVFIINPDLEILWEYLPEHVRDRAPSQTILENLP